MITQMSNAPTLAWYGADVLVLSPTPTHPQDYGNRKRIFSVCSQLKERGARVTLAHYPTETEWRSRMPSAARTMASAWHAYYTLPVTTSLHPAPKGPAHLIDEWWDDAIGGFLKWLFSVCSFDVFIVNYSWLSKALEFAPPTVVKILDTHDRLTDRQHLLKEHGIEPEYFYTTSDQEAIAIRRADVVWAVKEQERSAFEALGGNALTLSHLDRQCQLPPAAVDPEGYLRVGFIGARNNLNVKNFLQFLSTAIPLFEKFFAPIKIVVGGSMCEWLPEVDRRFVEVMGCLADVTELYRIIDLICIPMQFSTGVKIKTGEALALGLPVVSLAHGFEGYISQHPLHTLSNFREMAERLVDIAYDRSLLSDLRKASLRAAQATRASIVSTMERTWRMVQRERKIIAYCVSASVFDEMAPERFAFVSTLQYLATVGDVVVIVAAGSVASLLRGEAQVSSRSRFVVDPDMIEGDVPVSAIEERGFEVARISDILRRFDQILTVVDVLCEGLLTLKPYKGCVVLRTEMIAQTAALRSQQPMIEQILKNFSRAYVMAPRSTALIATIAAGSAARLITGPCCWQSSEAKSRLERRQRADTVAILINPRVHGLFAVDRLLQTLGLSSVFVIPIGFELSRPRPVEATHTCIHARDYLSQIIASRSMLPRLVLDLSFGLAGVQYLREIFVRLAIPTIVASGRIMHASTATYGNWHVCTYERLISEILRIVENPGHPAPGQHRFAKEELDGDAGWAWLDRYGFNGNGAEFRSGS